MTFNQVSRSNVKALADLLESSIRPHIIWHCLNQAILKGRGHDYVRFTWNLY